MFYLFFKFWTDYCHSFFSKQKYTDTGSSTNTSSPLRWHLLECCMNIWIMVYTSSAWDHALCHMASVTVILHPFLVLLVISTSLFSRLQVFFCGILLYLKVVGTFSGTDPISWHFTIPLGSCLCPTWFYWPPLYAENICLSLSHLVPEITEISSTV